MISTYINLKEFGLDNKIQVLTLSHAEAVSLIEQLLHQLANQAKKYSADGGINDFVIRGGSSMNMASRCIFNIEPYEPIRSPSFEQQMAAVTAASEAEPGWGVDCKKSQGI